MFYHAGLATCRGLFRGQGFTFWRTTQWSPSLIPTIMISRVGVQHFRLAAIRASPMPQNLRPPLLSTFFSQCPRSCFSTQPAEPATAVEFIEDKELGKTLIFGKTWCGFSNQAKSFLEQQGATYTAVELDLRGDGTDIQMELHEITGQRTVPSV